MRCMVPRQILMIELDADNAAAAAARVLAVLPDAQVWGEVDPVDAALLVIDQHLVAAA